MSDGRPMSYEHRTRKPQTSWFSHLRIMRTYPVHQKVIFGMLVSWERITRKFFTRVPGLSNYPRNASISSGCGGTSLVTSLRTRYDHYLFFLSSEGRPSNLLIPTTSSALCTSYRRSWMAKSSYPTDPKQQVTVLIGVDTTLEGKMYWPIFDINYANPLYSAFPTAIY